MRLSFDTILLEDEDESTIEWPHDRLPWIVRPGDHGFGIAFNPNDKKYHLIDTSLIPDGIVDQEELLIGFPVRLGLERFSIGSSTEPGELQALARRLIVDLDEPYKKRKRGRARAKDDSDDEMPSAAEYGRKEAESWDYLGERESIFISRADLQPEHMGWLRFASAVYQAKLTKIADTLGWSKDPREWRIPERVASRHEIFERAVSIIQEIGGTFLRDYLLETSLESRLRMFRSAVNQVEGRKGKLDLIKMMYRMVRPSSTPDPGIFRNADSMLRWLVEDDQRWLYLLYEIVQLNGLSRTLTSLSGRSPEMRKWREELIGRFLDKNWQNMVGYS